MIPHWVSAYWSYILGPPNLFALYVTGKKKAWGWLMGASLQVLWIVFALSTRNYGFLPGSLFTVVICVKSFREWTAKPEDAFMGDKLDDLYRKLRYALETSLEPTDADSAVAALDELVKEVRREDATKLLKRQEERSNEFFPDFPDDWQAESDTWDAAADLINPDKL